MVFLRQVLLMWGETSYRISKWTDVRRSVVVLRTVLELHSQSCRLFTPSPCGPARAPPSDGVHTLDSTSHLDPVLEVAPCSFKKTTFWVKITRIFCSVQAAERVHYRLPPTELADLHQLSPGVCCDHLSVLICYGCWLNMWSMMMSSQCDRVLLLAW